MTPDRSTERIEIEGSLSAKPAAAQPSTDAWSFGERALRLFAPVTHRDGDSSNPHSRNLDARSTSGVQRTARPDTKPASAPEPQFGKRSLRPLYQWEGVVEEVNGDSFRARLVPYEDGQPIPSRIEFSEFAHDDLADESDADLVEEGAVFYWTIAKSRNPAGTTTNVSLVRFRRLPPPGAFRQRLASREAQELMAEPQDASST